MELAKDGQFTVKQERVVPWAGGQTGVVTEVTVEVVQRPRDCLSSRKESCEATIMSERASHEKKGWQLDVNR